MGSRSLRQFEIFLDRTVYYAGQTVSGRLEVELSSPKKLQGIQIKFRGEANVEWSGSVTTPIGNNENVTRTVTFSAKETYFSMEHYLTGGPDEALTLPVGNHAFPFTFMLPPHIPSSFEGEHGTVRYTVRAVMNRPWTFNHEAKAIFTVIQQLDLNGELDIKEPVQRSSEKSTCCLWCKSSPILLDVSVSSTGFVPGQTIPMVVSLDNATDSHMEVTAHLYQTIAFHATSLTQKCKYEVCKATLGAVTSHGSGSWSHSLQVPSVPPSYLRGCNIIDISYKLLVVAHIDGVYRNLTAAVPVVIGTIPLVMYLPTSPPGFGDTKLPPAGMEPSAPLETPPPLYPGMDPPTYEECMQGKKNVREKDDNEYVSGDMEFAPCYPTYQFNR